MGVPKFYRWLSERYPLINQKISDETLLPDVDNFYLDMNGIIHACSHPTDNDFSKSLTYREMILGMFRYINRLVTEIVKPKRVLFMAVDGVAPRAKLNQQRSRRFRAAEQRTKDMVDAKRRGDVFDESKVFDSNCITPGTEFMAKVSRDLQWFIRKKIKEDPIWRNLEVIFSGAEIPGEGEHKIMEYIRDQRSQPNYQPNIRHCMAGNDADLIMLALSCHEPHFCLLREVVDFKMRRGGNSNDRQTVIRQTKDASFQLLHIGLLREYISLDLGYNLGWNVNEERIIDDFVMLTFLVGNDFLPHLPSMNISENAFDVIMDAYRAVIQSKADGYITENGEIKDFEQLEKLFSLIGVQESEILGNRETSQLKDSGRRAKYDKTALSAEELEEEEMAKQQAFEDAMMEAMTGESTGGGNSAEETSPNTPATAGALAAGGNAEAKAEGTEERKKDYRGRYYFEKFSVVAGTGKADSLLSHLCKVYLEGLMWCLGYYVKGCISWTWYYPYHYGPMLQDMKGIEATSKTIHLSLDQPFKPFQQLLGCLPPASKTMLPLPYQWLMTSFDSPMIHNYPLEFKITLEHNQSPWEAVVLLPFIDEVLLKESEEKHCPESKLSADEVKRNSFGKILIFKFEPGCNDTVYSSSLDVGLADIKNCQSKVEEHGFDITPGHYFLPSLVEGTKLYLAGFPSIGLLHIKDFRFEKFNIDVFGTKSKYKNVVMELGTIGAFKEGDDASHFLGRSIYVNYPLVHEARIVAISTEDGECRLVTDKADPKKISVEKIKYRADQKKDWLEFSAAERRLYKEGRGIIGTGGVLLDSITTRFRVQVLQGMATDPETGVRRKVFGETEADVPMQLIIWKLPYVDHRFEEKSKSSVPELFPFDTEVLCVKGKYKGCIGVVKGPHGPDNKWKGVVPEEKTRRLTVELSVPSLAERDFARQIITSMQSMENYFSLSDMSRAVGIDNSLLGRLVGSLTVSDENQERWDIGLDFKKNGIYYLLGYARPVRNANNGEIKARPVWKSGDSVQVIGSTNTVEVAVADDVAQWEYSQKALAVIMDYKKQFPELIKKLTILHNNKFLNSRDVFPKKKENETLLKLLEWMKCLPCSSAVRNPVSTVSVPPEMILAIERAADIMSSRRKEGMKVIVETEVPLSSMYRLNSIQQHSDVAMNLQVTPPAIGDRVSNLNVPSVPPGLRGTVVSVHTKSGYVDVVFDEEFYGGKNLQGSCSEFRGKLCAWSSLMKLAIAPPGAEAVSPPVTIQKSASSSAGGAAEASATSPTSPRQTKPAKTAVVEKPVVVPTPTAASTSTTSVPAVSSESSSQTTVASSSVSPIVDPLASARSQLSAAAGGVNSIVMNRLFFDDPIAYDPFEVPMGAFIAPPQIMKSSSTRPGPTFSSPEGNNSSRNPKEERPWEERPRKTGGGAVVPSPKPKESKESKESPEVANKETMEKSHKKDAIATKDEKPKDEKPKKESLKILERPQETPKPIMPPAPPSDSTQKESGNSKIASLLANAKAKMNKAKATETSVDTSVAAPPTPPPAPKAAAIEGGAKIAGSETTKTSSQGAKTILMRALNPTPEVAQEVVPKEKEMVSNQVAKDAIFKAIRPEPVAVPATTPATTTTTAAAATVAPETEKKSGGGGSASSASTPANVPAPVPTLAAATDGAAVATDASSTKKMVPLKVLLKKK